MPQCAVATCRNSHRRTRDLKVKYHRFPRLGEVRDRWVQACGRSLKPNGEPPFNVATARICSEHFEHEFYVKDRSSEEQSRLKLGAVPTRFVPVPVEPLLDVMSTNEQSRSSASRSERTRRGSASTPRHKHSHIHRNESDKHVANSRANPPRMGADDEQDDNNGGDDGIVVVNNGNNSAPPSSNADDSKTSLKTASKRSQHRSGSASYDATLPCSSREADQRERRRPQRNAPDPISMATITKEQFLEMLHLRPINVPLNLNKMHAMEGAVENRRNVNIAEEDKTKASSSQVPQSQQNGAALPEETATAPTTMSVMNPVCRKKKIKSEHETLNDEALVAKSKLLASDTLQRKVVIPDDVVQHRSKYGSIEMRKRKSTNGQAFASVSSRKKFRNDTEREELILRMIGNGNNETFEELMARATQLRSDILTLKEVGNTKEQEWNEILRKRKLTEEAYHRLERKIQMKAYMENENQQSLLSAGSSLHADWENNDNINLVSREKSFNLKEDPPGEKSSDLSVSSAQKSRIIVEQRVTPPKTNGESNQKQNDASSLENRQIGEGRQGAIVDVKSIIADHRLKHPDIVPKRGRRKKNSVNIGLGAGGVIIETGLNDSRLSSTESCKNNPNASDSMNYKDMLVQFAKMSQQGEPIKVPQNYPDVTLHPVAPSSASQNVTPQPTGSLLHGILTKAQSPRSTTFSPTLARLLTAPERERNSPVAAVAASMSQQNTTTQHLLQTYQGSNLVSINDLLSSSKARTEITITPVVNTSVQSHSNDLIQVEDVDEETTIIDERKGNAAGGRDSKPVVVKDNNPPSPNAPPKCQGCIIRPAQFVCAGCGNQWYCSRTCQLAAWATHSDHCPPDAESSKVKSNA